MSQLFRSIGSVAAAFVRSCPRIALQDSLYPNLPRKSFLRRYCELLYLRFRDGKICSEYTAAGLDIKGRHLADYITEIFRQKYIEPDATRSLSTRAAVLYDKELFSLVVPSFGLPVVGNMLRFQYVEVVDLVGLDSVIDENGEVFLKQVTGWCGQTCFKVTKRGGRLLCRDGLLTDVLQKGEVYIVQPVLRNHAELDKLNPKTLNTLRIVTGKSSPLAKVELWDNGFIRIGGVGAEVDNFWAGGVAIPFDNDGTLKHYGYTSDNRGGMTLVDVSPATGHRFGGFKVPYYAEALAVCLKAHNYFPAIKSIGWDVAITPSGPILIEGNHDWGNDIVQVVKNKGDMEIYKQFYLNRE